MIDPSSLDTLLHPQFDAEALQGSQPDGQGPRPPPRALPAARSSSPPTTPRSGKKRGEKVVLVRLETSPEDIDGHEGRPGHPDRPRRHDLPRGGRCPRHGHLLRLRLRRHRHGRGEQEVHPRRQDRSTKATSSPSTAPPATSTTASSRPLTPPSPATSAASWAGPTSTARLQCPHQRRHPARREAGPRVRRRGHRPLPHRAHVLRSRPYRRVPRDDRAPTPSKSARPLLRRSCRISRATLRQLYEALEGVPVTIRFLDPPLHEFVPTPRKRTSRLLAKTQGKTVDADQEHHRLSARVQPDDGSPRLPSGRHLSRRSPRCRPRAVIRAAINVQEEPRRLDHRARDHDPAGRRGQGAQVRQGRRRRHRRRR